MHFLEMTKNALTVFILMNKKTHNGRKWGGSYPNRRLLVPSFICFRTENVWRRALTVLTQMNKKTHNGQKWGGSYPSRRPLEPSFMRFLTGNLWRRALTVFTQMNKKTRNGQKWGVVTLKLFNNSKIWIINEYFPKIGFLDTLCPWGARLGGCPFKSKN